MIIDPSTFTTWATMRPRVLRRAPECPSFRIDDALKEAAAEFFETSRVWRSSRDTLLTTVADQLDYTFTAPAEAEVHAVVSAWAPDDTELDVALPGEQDDQAPDDDTDDFKVGARPTDILFLTAPPTTADAVIVGVLCFKPASDATGIPTEAWERWKEGIACGAAAMLVTEPGKPWSNPQTYSFLRGQFEEAIREASNSAGPVLRRPLRVRAL